MGRLPSRRFSEWRTNRPDLNWRFARTPCGGVGSASLRVQTNHYQASGVCYNFGKSIGEGDRPMLSGLLSRFARKNLIQTLNPPAPVNAGSRNLFDRWTPFGPDPPLAADRAAAVWNDRETTGASFSVDAVTPADRVISENSILLKTWVRDLPFRRRLGRG